MSNTDPGKEHYSMQEMMDRLREGRASGGRGEGSRRRRSHQPLKQARQRRKRWVIVLIVLLALVFGGALLISMLNSVRIKGEIFRQAANRRLSALTKTEVDCDRFSPRGWHHLDCPNIQFKGSGGVFKNALLQDVKGDLSSVSFFRNEWDAEQLTIGKASVDFQMPVAPRRADDNPTLAVADPAADDSFRLGVSAEPSAVTAHSFLVEHLDVSWPDSQNQPVRLAEVKARGAYVKGMLELSATGGRLVSPTWGEIPVTTLTAKFSESGLVLENARLRLTEERQLHVSGPIQFGRDGASAALDVKLDNCLLAELLRPAWQKRIHGKFIPGRLTFTAKPGAEEELSGDFSIEGLVLENFPGLKVLTAFFKTELYQKLELRQMTAKFSRTPSRLSVYDINGSRHGEARLTGEVTIFADGRLDGKLRLAVNTVESNLPGFSGEEDGLDVIEINLGGTEAAPLDNLAEKFPVPAEAPAPQ